MSTTTYTVAADRNAIQVTIDATLTSYIQDTATTIFYVDAAYLALLLRRLEDVGLRVRRTLVGSFRQNRY